MVILPHATVGASLGLRAKGPVSAFLMGAASHFLLDAVPHADYPIEGKKGKMYLLGDAALAAGAVVLMSRKSKLAAFGALGGIAPDLVSFSQRLFLGGSTAWHDFAHTRPAPLAPSLISQGLLSGAVLASELAGGADS